MTERADSRWMGVIDKYYSDNQPLRELLLLHSRLVADKALKVAELHPELGLDRQFVEEASMLHDIGIFLTDAAPIHCKGSYPYICHGYLGSELLVREGLPRHALVAERHTGTGLSLEQILERNLPVPHRDMIPVSLEETVICFADKFFSKTHPEREKSVDEAAASLSRFGEDTLLRFRRWCDMFL